ncbi:NEK SER THR kinase family protein [Cryptosporidium andersoni]|uniref:non-specific serine/threonine protein kinase n=1 Tax=Cryptosporidium andersoni TaxID=117008 RepID=A0A1J4MRZ3_9CRYT|nr:NEK SER THR kinase family protein [Cryptosporidium andersoni]
MEKYIIKAKVGEGGSGECWLAESIKDKCKVAIKIINISNINEVIKCRAIHETKILSMIKHQNIIEAFESYSSQNMICIIMEYADKGDLNKFLKIRQNKTEYLTENEVMFIFLQILMGIKSLHERDIVHGDIKTSNIVLFSNGLVKISDFGSSKIEYFDKNLQFKNTSYSSDLNKLIIGTPHYMAPETYSENICNINSDIWSLGCILVELCLLYPIFEKLSFHELLIFSLNNKDKFQELIFNCIENFKIEKRYSNELYELCKLLLNIEPELRPKFSDLFKNNNYIRTYMSIFLKSAIKYDWIHYIEIEKICNEYKILKIEKSEFEFGNNYPWKNYNINNLIENIDGNEKLDIWFKNKEIEFHKNKDEISDNILLFEDDKISEYEYPDIRTILQILEIRGRLKPKKILTKEQILTQLNIMTSFFSTQLNSLNKCRIIHKKSDKIINISPIKPMVTTVPVHNSSRLINNKLNKYRQKKYFTTLKNKNIEDNKKVDSKLKLNRQYHREELKKIIKQGREKKKMTIKNNDIQIYLPKNEIILNNKNIENNIVSQDLNQNIEKNLLSINKISQYNLKVSCEEFQSPTHQKECFEIKCLLDKSNEEFQQKNKIEDIEKDKHKDYCIQNDNIKFENKLQENSQYLQSIRKKQDYARYNTLRDNIILQNIEDNFDSTKTDLNLILHKRIQELREECIKQFNNESLFEWVLKSLKSSISIDENIHMDLVQELHRYFTQSQIESILELLKSEIELEKLK